MSLNSPVITNDKGEVIIYQNPNGSIEVNLKNGQIWLSQDKIAQLFDKSISTINEHITNIFLEGEVSKSEAMTKFGNSENSFVKPKNYYNLDLVLSVGYRTNSKSATKFRQWSNTILNSYIYQGFAINQDRLEEIKSELSFLINNKNLLSNSTFEFLLDRYTHSLATLNRFDENRLPEVFDDNNTEIDLNECLGIIAKTKITLVAQNEAWDGFGKELDSKFNSTIGALNQTFGGQPVYNRSQKLANLLYLVVKNHSFVDGNKRIGAILFVYFCSRAGITIDPNNLISLTLLVAQSNPTEKDNTIKLIQIIIN
jgi:prophage maintenance system killer protein